MTSREARRVLAALTKDGGTARFVGGCVRDAVLDRPVTDIDIATDVPPEEVMARLARAGVKAVPTGIEHGTVTAVTGASHFEVTTLRTDVETFGRRARVAFTDDWAADAMRRDFTINALFCDADGTLYDPVGGLADLEAGRVRFVGDAATRIGEDRLRLLRFYRFDAYYGTPPPDEAARAAARAAAGELPSLSAERIWSELRRLLLAPRAAEAFALMRDDGVLASVLPEATRIELLAPIAAAEAARAAAPDPTRRLAAIVETDEAGATGIARRLRLSRHDTARLAAVVARRDAVGAATDLRALRVLLYRLGAPLVRDLLLIAEAEHGAAGADWPALHGEVGDWRPLRLPVGGRDAEALGIAPGKAMGEALAAVEVWWIDEDFRPDRAACRARLAEVAKGVSSPF